MYEKIMVPLDGSEFAECVLPHVEEFIKGYPAANVVFMFVVQPVAVSFGGDYVVSPEILKERELADKSAAKDYLNQIIHRFKHVGVELHSEVLVGRAADSLADFAEKNNFDLVLIATHGHSGVKRWVRGSVADKILRSSNIPVLMVRAPGSKGGI